MFNVKQFYEFLACLWTGFGGRRGHSVGAVPLQDEGKKTGTKLWGSSSAGWGTTETVWVSSSAGWGTMGTQVWDSSSVGWGTSGTQVWGSSSAGWGTTRTQIWGCSSSGWGDDGDTCLMAIPQLVWGRLGHRSGGSSSAKNCVLTVNRHQILIGIVPNNTVEYIITSLPSNLPIFLQPAKKISYDITILRCHLILPTIIFYVWYCMVCRSYL
jgi:hypothetical protein